MVAHCLRARDALEGAINGAGMRQTTTDTRVSQLEHTVQDMKTVHKRIYISIHDIWSNRQHTILYMNYRYCNVIVL